jgi:hypothetical protein
MLDERHRDKLVTMHDCLTCTEIDGRNSVDKEDDIWQCISKIYNDPLWVPRLHIFNKLQFLHEMTLSLSSDAEAMTRDLAKGYVKDLWGKFKKAFSGWQARGSGKEGCAKETERTTLLIDGTDYDVEPTPEPCDESVLIKFVDDDRLKFCNGNQSTAYFWDVIEQCGLTSFCLQNLGNFGLVNGKAPPTKGGGQGTESSLKKD